MKAKVIINNLKNHQTYVHLLQRIEQFLQNNGYQKLMLPVLSPVLIPESYLEVFQTEYRYMDQKENLYLTPSPELFIKRLLAEGVGDCYYLGKSFRNSEPGSPKHSPEFTMLEFYKLNADYMDIADEVLTMLQYLAKKLCSSLIIKYQGHSTSLDHWEKFTVAEAFQKYANIDDIFDESAFRKSARDKGYQIHDASYEDLWSQIYVQEVEPHLGMKGLPTLIYDYPVQFASLSTPNPDGRTAQRFEFYIAGVELGNCYSELNDPKLQRARLEHEHKKRQDSGKIQHPIDEGFVQALEKGMPKSSGIAIGVERLAMIFADVESIEDLQVVIV